MGKVMVQLPVMVVMVPVITPQCMLQLAVGVADCQDPLSLLLTILCRQ